MAITWGVRFLVWGFISAFLSTITVKYCLTSEASTLLKGLAGVFAVVIILSTVVALHISTLQCSESHTLKTLLLQYFMVKQIDFFVPFLLYKMTKAWKNPMQAQEKLLLKLLARDAKTEYGMTHGFSDIKSLQEFREKHPLTKYDHYRDYFTRLADGEKNVCLAADIYRFGTSSGTTGKGKLIPMVLSSISGSLIFSVMRIVNPPSPVRKLALLYCKPTPQKTKTGIDIAPAFFMPDYAKFYTDMFQNTPFCAFQISTDFEATYVHMLFALTDKNIFQFLAPFASQVYRAFAMLEEEQGMFLEDLTLGRVNPKIQLDEGIRRSLDAALTADPARADELRREFAKGFVGIVGRIWPHLHYVLTADISNFFKKLDAKYTKGTKLFSGAYGCTEGFIGVNLWIDKPQMEYVLIPNDIIVEFIPESLVDEENPDTLFMNEVEVGQRYEVALTTLSGFYRYRMGDVIEVVGHHEKCPLVTVKYRTGELLNLRSEKIDVLVVNKAIQESLEGWDGATLVEWTCAESPLLYEDKECDYDMHYLLFVELESETDIHLSADQKTLFDSSLRKQHDFYDHYRKVGTICEAHVHVVRPGSFNKLKDHIVATSTASYNQFKMPKKLRTRVILDFMLDCVLESDVKN
ncbi:probable indole-3-acetic acid-amido synthetase GH3.9 isoform X1 [Asterias rubens]|uniref:probable indole-3-acetic acid-amido synthetase GH3.9 isoform X1 n=2 Tax=Asterias rubens TaxID=7604 RepID=UPI0014558D1E|nr:probable indole-3-acetic acid-amido synthetase GH3.9 isoform X1 [Asterias rubens]